MRLPGLRSLLANWRVKLASLLVAALLFAHVYTEREDEVEYLAPVRVMGLAPGLAVEEVRPAFVRVKVQSTGKDHLRMRVEPPEMEIDWRGLGPGVRVINTSGARVVFPVHSNARLSHVVSPGNVSVSVDTLARVQLPVRVTLAGNPANGVVVQGDPVVEPDSVTVAGPGRLVASLNEITLAPVDLSGHDRSFRRDSRVAVSEIMTATPPHVRVTVIMGRR